MTNTHHIILLMLAVLAGSLLLAALCSPRAWIRLGCRMIAFGEGSATFRREWLRLWLEFTSTFRSRTEELRREYRVAGREA